MKLTYDDFRDYLRSVNKLYALTSSFIEYYNNVIKQANGKNVHELREELRNIVLSGLKHDGEYTENAYALFIKDFTGLSIEDPKLYVSKLKLETRPNVKVVIEESRFVEYIQLLNSISGFIVNKVKELNLGDISISVEERNTRQVSIENLIAEIIKTSYDLSVGVNSFSTSVWGLRKITPHYMNKAYKDLPEDLLKPLGFSKLLSIKDYELWGFPDYFTKCMLYDTSIVGGGPPLIIINGVPIVSYLHIVQEYVSKQQINPIAPTTIGGAICVLNEIIWRYTKLLKSIISKWFEGYMDLESTYMANAWKSLDDIGWVIPSYIEETKIYAELKDLLEGIVGSSSGSPFKFLIYDDGIVTKCLQWFYRGGYDRSGFSEYKLSRYVLLPELFDDLMPAMFLGAVDTTLYLNDRKALLILVRTKRGG